MLIDVLVVDDDEDIRTTLGEILRDEGYQVSERASVANLAETLAEERPRLVLLDLTIPGFSPETELNRAREMGMLEGTQVYALSGLEETHQVARRLHLNGAVRKPFDMNELLDLVARACREAPSGSDGHPESSPPP